jgi:hypothetical protein
MTDAQSSLGDVLPQAFSALLKDPVPALRAQAVKGLVGVLDAFWELLPAATTAGFIAALIDDMVHDTASAAVRPSPPPSPLACEPPTASKSALSLSRVR